MIIRFVGPDHDVSKQKLHGAARRFFKDVLPKGTSDGAVIARANRQTVGWLRYTWDARHRTLSALGTWCEPEYRGGRVAEAVWKRAMRTFCPKRVEVTTVTRGGRRLMTSIARTFANVTFEIKAGW